MPKPYSTSSEGIDYFFLIIRHLDRMSESIRAGLDVGVVNTQVLVGYYQQVMHLEALLVPFLHKDYYTKRNKFKKELPGYSKTWSGKISDQIQFFEATTKLLKLLIVKAYNARVLKVKIKREYKSGEGDLFE